jgi:uncharacterized membrane protein YccF (DUF307 family)
MRLLLNILWFVHVGWWLALMHLVGGVLLCLTVIGIPLGLASFRLIPISLTPLGREIASVEQAQAPGPRSAQGLAQGVKRTVMTSPSCMT